MRRRQFVCGCAGLAITGCGGNGDNGLRAGDSLSVRGCGISLQALGMQYPGCNGLPISSSGNVGLDVAFASEFQLQKTFWGLSNVTFSFLDDCNGPNAYADRDTASILFGLNLATSTYSQFGSALPWWQVLAHEFGHQIQYWLGSDWLGAPTVAPTELEADMFSGIYILLNKPSFDPAEISTILTNAFSIGDYQYNNRNHHGTPLQRGAAVVAGGRVALRYAEGTIPRTYSAIRELFLRELQVILNDPRLL